MVGRINHNYMKKWTEEDIETIKMYHDKISRKSLALKLNCCSKALYDRLNALGLIEKRRNRKEFSKDEINQIKLYYEILKLDCLPKNYLQLIADKFNRKKISISKILERHGIKNKFKRKKYTCDDNYFSIIDNATKAYWLGFIAADGSIDKNKKMLSIAQHEKDEAILLDFLHDLSSNGIIYKRLQNHKKSIISRIQIYSSKLVDDLEKLGIRSNKTFDLNWDECIKFIPNKLIIDFVRGYFDGDGSWKKSKNKINFDISGASINFINGLKGWIERELNLNKTKIYSKKLENKRGKYKFYSIQKSSKKDICALYKAFYYDGNIRFLQRKFDKILKYIKVIDLI